MAIGFAIASIAIAAGSLAYSLYLMKKNKNNQNRMEPASLDDFGITQSREGAALPLVYGRKRINGTLLWYGNLETEEITEGGGGKGFMGGGGGAVTGINYYLDSWQAISLGKIELVETYINDDQKPIEAGTTYFNDGTETTKPTEPGEFTSKLPGVSHVFYKRWFVGENTTVLPIVHFVVDRILPLTVNWANETNGNNPAAAVYDVLLKAGADQNGIDLASFNVAADFWHSKNYGINLLFSAQQDAAEIIQKILGFVDGALYINDYGRYALRAYDPAETPAAAMTQDDFIKFKFTRRSYHEIYNDFRGNFTDSAMDFTNRVVSWPNPAVQRLVGYKKQLSVDLSAFRDVDTASKRLTEIGKKNSYPEAEIDFETNLSFDMLIVGDVVSIAHSDYGLFSAEYRITDISYSENNKNTLKFKAVQMIETLFDDVYQQAGGSLWTAPTVEPVALVKQYLFELPYNSDTLKEKAFLLLAARELGIETSFQVIYSNTGSDYQNKGIFATWAQHGLLDETYPLSTYKIDDSVGILYTPYKEDFAPAFGDISRTDLFYRRRVAIIGNEMISFQTVTPEGPVSYRLGGVIRGVLNTPIEAHIATDPIWIVEITENNVLKGISAESFYLKYLPIFQTNTLAAGSASAIPFTVSDKAATPWRPGRITAVRSATDQINLIVFPDTQDTAGAGAQPEDTYTDQAPPFSRDGDFVLTYNATTVYSTSTNVLIVYSGDVEITVKHRVSGRSSAGLTITVSAPDGNYYA